MNHSGVPDLVKSVFITKLRVSERRNGERKYGGRERGGGKEGETEGREMKKT